MNRDTIIRAIVVALVASTISGCALDDPYRTPPRHADRPEQRDGASPDADGIARTPQQALERFALIYVNWTAATLESRQRELASSSVGAARANALRAAAAAARDVTRRHADVRNRGSVVAIAAGIGRAAGSWVIVTVETTSGRGPFAGLPPDTAHVTYAKVQRAARGFIVSSWSPQS